MKTGLTEKRPASKEGGLRGGEDQGYGTADSGDALLVTEDGVQAVTIQQHGDRKSVV